MRKKKGGGHPILAIGGDRTPHVLLLHLLLLFCFFFEKALQKCGSHVSVEIATYVASRD